MFNTLAKGAVAPSLIPSSPQNQLARLPFETVVVFVGRINQTTDVSKDFRFILEKGG